MMVRNVSATKLLRRWLSYSSSSSSSSSSIYKPPPPPPTPVSHPLPPILLHIPLPSSFLNPSKTLPFSSFASFFLCRHLSSSCSPPVSPLTRDGNYDDAIAGNLLICPGCGVHMQDSEPKLPGFFLKPSPKKPFYKSPINKNPIADESQISDSFKKGFLTDLVQPQVSENNDGPLDHKGSDKPIVCSRCHSLRYYGKVKDPTIENLLPDFDFDHTVGRRLMSVNAARTVVLMIVDASDFDGSFPRAMARLVSRTIDENSRAWKERKPGNVPRVVMVVTKIDLLPSSLSPTTLEHWVRTRAREGGATKLTSVHLVSAVRDWGVKNLVDVVVRLAGPRGHVWAVGAQNAGKSTLINAIGKSARGKLTHLTEAPVPGTTLGIVRVEGVLPGSAKLFDTPGLLHPHQISTRLNREEQTLVHISKELKPRTYRIKAGYSVHIGGLLRLDIEELSVDSVYVTIWASPLLPLHMGKMENACTMLEEHFGSQLQPPIGEGRVKELGQWLRKEFHVTGHWWDTSCVDIAAAGLGWFAIGLKGEAVVGVWTYDGVDVIVRNALLPQRSLKFEVAGFTTSKIVSRADRALNKNWQKDKKKKVEDPTIAAVAAVESLQHTVDAAST